MRNFILPIALLCASACSNNDGKFGSDLSSLPVVEIRATGDIDMPEPMTRAAFVPNYVAGWASHILLLSDTGNIWQTTTEGAPPRIISEGEYTDVVGLSREGQAGAFLTLSDGGKLSAFIESDDEGNFQSIAVSYGGTDLIQFCEGATQNTVWALSKDGNAYPLSTSFNAGVVAEVSAGDPFKAKSTIKACRTDEAGTLYVQLKTGEWVGKDKDSAADLSSIPRTATISPLDSGSHWGFDPQSTTLFHIGNTGQSRIDIVDGLSIHGIKSPRFTAVTPYPMGSVFNEGLIVIGDADTPRIVIISAAFARQQLTPDGQ